MSLLWLDGFDWMAELSYANSQYALKKRYQNANMGQGAPDGIIAEGRQGGRAVQFNAGGQFIQTGSLQDATDSDHIYAGYAVRTGPALGHNVSVFSVSSGTTTQCYFTLYSDGSGKLFPGGGVFDTTLRPDRWYYIELHFLVNNTGSAEFKVNGEVIHTVASGDFQAGSASGWTSFVVYSHGSSSRVDDLYVCNDQGSTNNTYLGDTRVVLLNPSGDDTTQWAQSGVGGHYEEVDDNPVTPPDAEVWTDDDYIESNTTSNKDLFDYEDLPSEFASATIKAVQCFSVIRTTNAQVMSFKDICKSGTTEVDLSTTAIMWDNYHPLVTIQETDPDTAGAWTYATVNAALFGVKVG